MLRDVFYYGSKPNVHPREKFARDLADARNQCTTEHFWIINEYCDYRGFDWDFDFEFLPDEDVWAEEHNNVWPSQHQKDSGTWLCPKEHSDLIVYRSDVDPIIRKNIKTGNWVLLDEVDESRFDFSWHPDPSDPPYIYKWGCKFFSVELHPVLEYHVEGATQAKYLQQTVELMPQWDRWTFNEDIDTNMFDFSWRPDPREPAFIYAWGNQWNKAVDKISVQYAMPGATQYKFVTGYMHRKPCMDNWVVPENIDVESFDFSWEPSPNDHPFIYQFGTQWQKTDGPKYVVPGATSIKYIDTLKATVLPTTVNWEVPNGLDTSTFDFSWHPDSTAPKYIYQFGTILDDVHLKDGPRYVTPDNNGEVIYIENVLLGGNLGYPKYMIKTTLEELILEHPNEIFWAIRNNIDYSTFDFEWRPTKEQAFNINVFGSADSELTQTYFVNSKFYEQGFRDKTFIEDKKIEEINLSQLFVKPNMFFIDRSNPESDNRFNTLKQKFPDLQKTRYLNSWVDTINRCVNRSSTELCWILNSELDYTDFDFDYYPNPWQMKMVNVFGTQWSHWGTTFLVNKESFATETKYVKVIEHLNSLNFVKDQSKRAKATDCLYDIFLIDFGNEQCDKVFTDIKLKSSNKSVTRVQYCGNYLDTFKEILSQVQERKEHYIWICSSVCDYEFFDFTYICDPFSREQLHVFPSGSQKYGDTFLVNVNRLTHLINDMKTLEDYQKINFNRHLVAPRYPAPEIVSSNDTHTSGLVDFDFPYAEFVTSDNTDIEKIDYEPVNLWAPEKKNIIITSTGGTRIVVPKEAKDIVKRELYDYPYIVKSSRLAKSKPLDIVFLSNGEKCADENYEHLLNVTKGLNNRIVRVDGVNGRVAAYHAAAEASESPWMFTVFAKLKVSNKFDWNWQPDRLQVPKHYVFHATNPVNNLVYGHQAMIAYNKKMTLANTGQGLDFTQDDVHEVVEINSGVANFNVDEWTTWRTAFRECIKLCTYADEISKQRLKIWTTVAEGDFAQYCLDGANDAVKYFDEVAGDFDALKMSYDWAWLNERFNNRYK